VNVRYCPNPDCPYTRRHHEAAEYRDEAMACSDCGAALTSEPPAVAEPAAPRPALPWGRLALTVGVPVLVAWVGPQVPLPGLDREELEHRLGAFAHDVRLSVFALGLTPFISAFLLVEVAALIVPRWRPLRVAGPEGRGRLTHAAVLIGLSLAIIQATAMTTYISRMGAAETGNARVLVALTLVGGTCVLLAVAGVLDRVALGGGVSLLLTALGVGAAWPGLSDPDQVSAVFVCAALLVVAGTIVVLRWRPREAPGAPPGLPLPACGLLPWHLSASIVTFVGEAANGPTVIATLTAVLAVAFGFLFYRPSKVAAFAPDPVGRVTRTVALSAAYVVGLALLEEYLLQQLGLPPLRLLPLVLVVAVSLDVFEEARAVRRHGELVPVWPEHRLYAVDATLEALDSAGIPGLARSRYQRVLWHFFAPHIPIQILVPRARAEEAVRVIALRSSSAP
jgi:hypothetical protein